MKESEVRDFIADNFTNFESYITNLDSFSKQITTERDSIIAGETSSSPILISELIKLTIIDKLTHAIPVLKNLILIDKEFILLKTESVRGKQPSVDLLAYNSTNYCLALIELKISDSSEREAITELSAYNQGLQNTYRGLSSLEVIWIPISTEWRCTTKSAIEFELLWKNTLLMPLLMSVNYNQKESKVLGVSFECFDPTNSIIEEECLNLFSFECFEAFDYYTATKIENKEAFINYVAATCSRYNINGFVIFHKPVDLQYPYGFTLCIYNPYKGHLHKKISTDFINEYGKDEYYKTLKNSGVINIDLSDVDFKTSELKYMEFSKENMDGASLKYDAYWDKDFLGVGEFAGNPENQNINFLFEEIKRAIDSNGETRRALGVPNFESLFRNLCAQNVDSINYLGVHLELISKRIHIEHRRKLHADDYFSRIASFDYLKMILAEYNFKQQNKNA